jgi:hypothetical protein
MAQQADPKIGRPCYCPGCLTVLPIRYDKKGKPYFRCQFCALTIFMGTEFAYIAFLMMQNVVAKAPERWREMVRQSVTAKTKSDYASKMREGRLAATGK